MSDYKMGSDYLSLFKYTKQNHIMFVPSKQLPRL